MDKLIEYILNEAVWPFLILLSGVAVVVFIYGLIEFILGADNEEKRNKGKKHLVWGLIGLFIMASASGIVALIANFISSL